MAETAVAAAESEMVEMEGHQHDEHLDEVTLLGIEAIQPKTDQAMSNISPLMPLSDLSSALSRKAPLNHLSSWIALSLTLEGRDKLTKFIQYSCRLLAWWYNSSSSTSAVKRRNLIVVECYRSLYKSLAEARKSYRLGRTVTELHKLVTNHGGIGSHVLLKLTSKEKTDTSGSNSIHTNANTSSVNHNHLRWRNICTPLKLTFLAAFWLSDNLAYLTSTGFLDSCHISNKKERLTVRNMRKARASKNAVRFYFMASAIGLYANVRELLLSRNELEYAFNQYRMALVDAEVRSEQDTKQSKERWEKENERYFSCVISLLKSVCDTLVFGNNPGVDLYLKCRGHRMHEGLHSIFGMISASTVLYNSFPVKKN